MWMEGQMAMMTVRGTGERAGTRGEGWEGGEGRRPSARGGEGGVRRMLVSAC